VTQHAESTLFYTDSRWRTFFAMFLNIIIFPRSNSFSNVSWTDGLHIFWLNHSPPFLSYWQIISHSRPISVWLETLKSYVCQLIPSTSKVTTVTWDTTIHRFINKTGNLRHIPNCVHVWQIAGMQREKVWKVTAWGCFTDVPRHQIHTETWPTDK